MARTSDRQLQSTFEVFAAACGKQVRDPAASHRAGAWYLHNEGAGWSIYETGKGGVGVESVPFGVIGVSNGEAWDTLAFGIKLARFLKKK